MSALAVVLIVIGAVLLVLFIGGFVVARRRASRPGRERHIAAADQALEQARAADRGWDRELLHEAARHALAAERPGFTPSSLEIVLVDDRPGVEEDRAHVVAADDGERVKVVLARDSAGDWAAQSIE